MSNSYPLKYKIQLCPSLVPFALDFSATVNAQTKNNYHQKIARQNCDQLKDLAA